MHRLLAALLIAASCASCAPPVPDARDTPLKRTTSKKDAGAAEAPPGEETPIAKGSKGKSCEKAGVGADKKCGAGNGIDCCDAQKVPGGTYNRYNDASFPATVSEFHLDTFEVTAGRFRAWVDATNGNLRGSAPAEGAGAHPRVKNSGWRAEWNATLPTSRDEVDAMFGPENGAPAGAIPACQVGTNIDDEGALTWWTTKLDAAVKQRNGGKQNVLSENTKEALDRKPLNCVPWHVLFAFCVWDGGRLPTDAEWGYAFSGGEQRTFPWGAATETARINGEDRLSLAPTFEAGATMVVGRLFDKTLGDGTNKYEDNYAFTYGGKVMAKSDNALHIAPVGNKPAGNGKWGHTDLAGGMFEWMLDEGPIAPGDCKDCANVTWPALGERDPNTAVSTNPDFQNGAAGIDWYKGGMRAIRGSAWDNAALMNAAQSKAEITFYTAYPVGRSYRALGGRCARDL